MVQPNDGRPSGEAQQTASGSWGSRHKQRATSSLQPPTLQHRGSAQTGQSISRLSTRPTGADYPIRPRMNRGATNDTGRSYKTANQGTGHGHRWSELRQEGAIGIDDDYFALNPWYERRPNRPMYSLASPYPHTMRNGMWWGKRGLREAMYNVNDDAKEYDGPDSQISLTGTQPGQSRRLGEDRMFSSNFNEDCFSNQHASAEAEPAPSSLQVPVGENDVRSSRDQNESIQDSIRPGDSEDMDHAMKDNAKTGGGDTRGINEHGLRFQDSRTHEKKEFGLQGGLPPLQETCSKDPDNASVQTQKEMNEEQTQAEKAQQDFYNQYRNPIARLRAQYPQAPAEWLATTIYLFLGLAGNLSSMTSDQSTGGYEAIAWSWGIALMVGIYVGGGISGAHVNPCTSISLTIYRGFPWKMCLVYIAAQMLAGFCAAWLAWFIYKDAILRYDPGLTNELTARAWYSIPKGWASMRTQFFNEFVSMAIYTCLAFALGDDQNAPPSAGMSALIFGLVSYALTLTMGYNTGLALSPARDMGPRIVARIVGYPNPFSTPWWFIGPWCASLSGALFGGFLYDVLIFVGGESPVNFRWPQPGDVVCGIRRKGGEVKDKVEEGVAEGVERVERLV